MSDLRPKHTTIELDGKEYGLLFDLNAVDEIQDRLDISISQLPDLMSDDRKVFKVLKTILAVLINEAIDDSESGEKHIDEKFVGRKIIPADLPKLTVAVISALTNSMPQSEDNDPNPQSE